MTRAHPLHLTPPQVLFRFTIWANNEWWRPDGSSLLHTLTPLFLLTNPLIICFPAPVNSLLLFLLLFLSFSLSWLLSSSHAVVCSSQQICSELSTPCRYFSSTGHIYYVISLWVRWQIWWHRCIYSLNRKVQYLDGITVTSAGFETRVHVLTL